AAEVAGKRFTERLGAGLVAFAQAQQHDAGCRYGAVRRQNQRLAGLAFKVAFDEELFELVAESVIIERVSVFKDRNDELAGLYAGADFSVRELHEFRCLCSFSAAGTRTRILKPVA